MKLIKKLLAMTAVAVAFIACLLSGPQVVAKAETTVDVTQNVLVSDWIVQSELKVTYLNLGADVIPNNVGYGIIDNNNYKYAQDYIAINGKTIKEINSDTSLKASTWTYTIFPSTADVKYKLPIIVYLNNGQLEIKIHSNYVALLGSYVEITAKAGLYFINDDTRYEVKEDKSFVVFGKKEALENDITESVKITGWDTTGNAGELTYTRIKLGTGVMPEDVSYGIIDDASYMYLQEYIAFNGETVADINANTDTSGYNFSTFPSSVDDKYKLPVIIYVNRGTLEVKVHNQYWQALKSDLIITVKSGLYVINGDKKYVVTQDVTYTLAKAIEEKDLAGNISLSVWNKTGDEKELTYTLINFGTGVLPSDIGYHVMDNHIGTHYHYIKDYIVINGKTVAEINESTDDKDYVYSTFPSTTDAQYAVPVILFGNGDNLEVKIHNNYVATLGEKIEITIKEGFYINQANVQYTLSRNANFILEGSIWADKDKVYTITYYLNGAVYGEAERLPYKTPFVLRDAPQTEAGYVFDGWECGDVSNVIQDMEIYGYTSAIRYNITYHLNGGVNDSTNPIVYYVTDGEIVLKEATKEGAVFKGWYTSGDYTQKVETISPEQLGDIELYALFEGGEAEAEGCGSSISMACGLVTLMGAAILFTKKELLENLK